MELLRVHEFRERVRWFLRRRFATPEQRKHIVFRHSGAFDPPLGSAVEDGIVTVRTPEELEVFFGLDRLCDVETARSALLDGDAIRVFAEQGRALALAFEGRPQPWFVPLAAADRVIYSVVTAREAMKKGLGGRIVKRIARDTAANGGTAWLDCALWNTRAHGAFTRAGFVRHDNHTYDAIANLAQPSSREIKGDGPETQEVGTPSLSIVIVNFRAADQVLTCLESLYAGNMAIDFEVIVVDNASGDGSASRIKQAWPQARVIEMTRNVGFAAGNNAGLALARGEFLLLLNPDTQVPPGTLRSVCDKLAGDPQVGVIGVPQDVGDGTLHGSALRFVRPIHVFLRAIMPLGVLAKLSTSLGMRYEEFAARAEFECDAVVGCFMAMRRDVLERVGGLEARIFMYSEELEYCYRVREAGYKVLHMGGQYIVHHHGATTRNIPVWRDVQMQQGQLVYLALPQGLMAARRAAASMALSHVRRLPLERVAIGPRWKGRIESRLKRLRRSLKATIRPPLQTRQAI
ncbi:MAG: GNAT family N-acetyltransferase [Porphyrobacter sp.]|nr:GNAT family N-acetyltransferase [Porphyrobacter sp.]